jgi:eukaryotic-like serine/threonine-protein kinase
MNQDFQLGPWTVQPSLNSISRNGGHLRLEPKAMEVLVCLAQSGGEVVSKEKLIGEVWAETFVGDDALIRCVSALRRALEDDPKSPRVIETIPKRGYRLLETVELITSVEPARPQPAKKTKRVWGIAIAAVVVVAAFAAFFYARRAHRPTEFDTVVLADFDNRTGDPVFDDTLKQALAAGLEQSPVFKIISDQKIRDTLPLMGHSPRDPLNEEIARDLCQRIGGDAVLSGSIARVGSHYAIGLNAANCATGDSLNRQAVEVEAREQVLKALGHEITTLRRSLGESLSSIRKFNVPLDQCTTPSLDALKAWSAADNTRAENGDRAAIPFLKHAIELDPNFAMAHAYLGTLYANLQEPGLSIESLTRAYELRDRTSARERFYIESHYYHLVTGELEKANQIYEVFAQTYPWSEGHLVNLGVSYGTMGQHDKAAATLHEALRRDPENYVAYSNLVAIYANLNRLDEARATYQKMLDNNRDYPEAHLYLYGVATVQGDAEEMRKQEVWAIGKVGIEDILLDQQADTRAFYGRRSETQEFSRRAVESAQRAGKTEAAALWQMNEALREAEFGNLEGARHGVTAALALAATRDVQTLAALIVAQSGDAREAQALSNDLARRYPLDTLINGYWLPTIRAAIEIDHNDPAEAIKVLQRAAPYELAAVLFTGNWTVPLHPVCVRGQAYLLLHRGKEAGAEYQKFLDHRGAVRNSPLGALARLGLARSYAMQGEAGKARSAYRDFLTLWKDADADIPILKAAKAEYAKLQ